MKSQREYGIKRYSVRNKIRAAMLNEDITEAQLAALVGISRQAVNATINGLKHSPRVLEKLREMGVPEKYLCDPRKPDAA